MRLSTIFAAGLACLASTVSAKCSKTITGEAELRAAQSAAIKKFGQYFPVEKNIRKAFDEYVPECVISLQKSK